MVHSMGIYLQAFRLLDIYMVKSYSDLPDLAPSRKPVTVAVQSSLTDGVQFVQENRHKTSRSTDVFLGRSILGGNFIHQETGEDGQELVGSVDG